jgi:hypothetical protein
MRFKQIRKDIDRFWYQNGAILLLSFWLNNESQIQSNLSIVVTCGRLTKWPLYTGDLYMKGFDFSTKYCTLVVNKHFSLHLMFLIMFYLLIFSCIKTWDSLTIWKQCFQFNVVLLEIVLLFIRYLYLFIYYHIEIISSTINVNKSNITTGKN